MTQRDRDILDVWEAYVTPDMTLEDAIERVSEMTGTTHFMVMTALMTAGDEGPNPGDPDPGDPDPDDVEA